MKAAGILKSIIVSAIIGVLSLPAFAQTAPNWTYQYVPSTAEWNAVFAGKQDYLGAPPCLITGRTITGELITIASTVAHAGFNIPPGVAPTSPVNGDIWTTTSGLFARINGATQGPFSVFPATTRAGDVQYWNGTSWVTLAGNNSGSNCFGENASGVPSWVACSGGSGSPGGSNTQLQVNSASSFGGISGATSNGTAVTFASSDLLLSGSSSGTVTLNAPATGGGTVTLPAGTATLAAANAINTWSAVQTFNSGDLVLAGSSSGSATLNAPATGGGVVVLPTGSTTLAGLSVANAFIALNTFSSILNMTGTFEVNSNAMTFPGSAATIAGLSIAQTWSAAQSFNNADLILKGSSTGTLTLECGSACGSSVITFPDVTDTVAVLGTADQIVTGGGLVTDLSLTTGSVTIDCGARSSQKITNGGNFTITAPTSGNGTCVVEVTNNGSAGTITFTGFSVNPSFVGATPDTTSGHAFMLFINRTNGHSVYNVIPEQ